MCSLSPQPTQCLRSHIPAGTEPSQHREQISAQGRPEGPSLMAACPQVRSHPSASSSGSCLAPASRPVPPEQAARVRRAVTMAMPAAAGPGSEGLQRKRKAVLQKSTLAFSTIPFLFFMHGQAGAGASAPRVEKEPGRAHGTCFGFVMGSVYGNGFHSNYLCQPGEEFYYRLLASLPALPPSEGSLIGQPFSGTVPSCPVP